MPEQPPFFILGCPRSGTTLLQILIDSHPAIAIPPESFLFDRFGPILPAYGDLADPAKLKALARDLLDDARIRDWRLNATPDDLVQASREKSAHGLFAALFTLYARQNGKTRWGDKTPQHGLCIPALLAVFPEARILHLVRDGRDVAESTARIAIGPCSILAIARRWKSYMEAAAKAAARLPPAQFLEIRYEDLVHDPTAARSRIMAFIGEDEAACPPLGQDLPQTGTLERSSAYAHHSNLKKAISAGKVGVYRTAFSARQIELFEAIAGDWLTRHGYAREVARPRPPTRGEEAAAWLQDHTLRYLRKFRQKGALRQIAYELKLALQKSVRNRRRGSPRA